MNKTGYTIREIYISPSKQNSWGIDILRKHLLQDGQKFEIKFNFEAKTSLYDLKVVYEDDEEAVWTGLRLDKLIKLTIYWEAENGGTTYDEETVDDESDE